MQLADYRPTLSGVAEQYYRVEGSPAEITFPIATPGDMTRLRFGTFYRARDARDGWDYQVSFDDGKTFTTVDRAAGPYQGCTKYVTVEDLPPRTRSALIRFSGQQRNTTCIFNFRIDADYTEPHGGFRPVKVTYIWDEAGQEKQDVHIAPQPQETPPVAKPQETPPTTP